MAAAREKVVREVRLPEAITVGELEPEMILQQGRTALAAVAPWSLAGGYGEVRRDALSWALLAPNRIERKVDATKVT